MIQKRIINLDGDLALRAEVDGAGLRYFTGYAAVYNSRSRLIAERGRVFYEVLAPGCFDRVLANPQLDVVLTLNHDKKTNMGRTKSGNLKIESDSYGLRFRCPVPNTTVGNDTYEMVQRGDYTDCSFAFEIEDSGEKWVLDGRDLIHEVREVSALSDLAICTLRGAYPATVIDTEKVERMYTELTQDEAVELQKRQEQLLREKNEREHKLRLLEYNGLNG